MGNLAGGLAQISTGLSQIGNGAEFSIKVEQKKKEDALKAENLKIDQDRLKIAKRQSSLLSLESLSEGFTMRAQNNEDPKAWIKLPENQKQIEEIAPVLGMSVEDANYRVQHDSAVFRTRKDIVQKDLTGYAATISKSNPQLAESLRDLSGLAAEAKTKDDLKTIMSDKKDLLTTAITYRKAAEEDSGITPSQFFGNFDEKPKDAPGSQAISVKGLGVKYGAPRVKNSNISTNASEDLTKDIAPRFGVMTKMLPRLTESPDDPEGSRVLPNINSVRVGAEERIKAGMTPAQAVDESFKTFQSKSQEADKALEPIINSDPATKKKILQRYGAKDLSGVPLAVKEKMLQAVNEK